MRHKGEELGLVRTQLAKGVSVFACDKYSVFSDVRTWLTPGPPVRIDSTPLDIDDLAAKKGEKEHLLNTEIFLQAWRQVHEEAAYRQHEWTVKVDPDAVFFPKRLRHELDRFVHASGASLYFLNCKYSFGLFGALEVYSLKAIETFFDGEKKCREQLDWKEWGEDLFMRRCMDLLGVRHAADYELLADGYCNEVQQPCTSGKVAYHAFKTVGSYLTCMEEAGR